MIVKGAGQATGSEWTTSVPQDVAEMVDAAFAIEIDDGTDSDHDGVSDHQESWLGTSQHASSTYADGVADGGQVVDVQRAHELEAIRRHDADALAAQTASALADSVELERLAIETCSVPVTLDHASVEASPLLIGFLHD